ncbi:MAG: MFS transporter [Anaerolineae bacterium]|nr:MFS transporter [Anaerolineae bacterium]
MSVCNMVAFMYGAGVTGLLPIYARRLGADSGGAGLYLALSFLALAVSTIAVGRLSDRYQNRKLFLIAGSAVTVPLAWLMGQATTFPLLVILTAAAWLSAGFAITMINVLTGLSTEESERGRIFGIVGLGGGIGAVMGSLASGPIVDRWGFTALFTLAAIIYIVMPIAALFLTDKSTTSTSTQHTRSTATTHSIFRNRTFVFLCCASIMAHLANSQLILARPLIMDQLAYGATAISRTGAVGALVGLPLPLLIGWLSDRLGRKPFLMICYLCTTVGLLILAAALDLWQFSATSILQTLLGPSLVVGSALITETFPRGSLGVPLSLFGSTPWIGFVIGFGGSGAAMDAFQMTPTLIIGAILAMIAAALLIPVQTPPQYRAKVGLNPP